MFVYTHNRELAVCDNVFMRLILDVLVEYCSGTVGAPEDYWIREFSAQKTEPEVGLGHVYINDRTFPAVHLYRDKL